MLFVPVSVKIRCPSIVSAELLQQLGCSIAGHGHQGLDSIETLQLVQSPVNISRGQDVVIEGPSLSVNIILEQNISYS